MDADAETYSLLAAASGAGNYCRSRLSGGISAPAKGGCSQNWLPHNSGKQLSCKVAPPISLSTADIFTILRESFANQIVDLSGPPSAAANSTLKVSKVPAGTVTLSEPTTFSWMSLTLFLVKSRSGMWLYNLRPTAGIQWSVARRSNRRRVVHPDPP